jgi:hypothetical protein
VWFRKHALADLGARDAAAGVFLTVLATVLTFDYVDYPVARVGPIPAAAIAAAFRLVAVLFVLVVSVAAAHGGVRLARRLTEDDAAAVAAVGVAALQMLYFFVDASSNPLTRVVHVAAVAGMAVGAATLKMARGPGRVRLGSLTAVALFNLLALQFAYFYQENVQG